MNLTIYYLIAILLVIVAGWLVAHLLRRTLYEKEDMLSKPLPPFPATGFDGDEVPVTSLVENFLCQYGRRITTS